MLKIRDNHLCSVINYFFNNLNIFNLIKDGYAKATSAILDVSNQIREGVKKIPGN